MMQARRKHNLYASDDNSVANSFNSQKHGSSNTSLPTMSLLSDRQVIDEKCGVASGGLPGGGDGYGGGSYWAAGVNVSRQSFDADQEEFMVA